jgi:uncharacterized protein (TIGR02391 family)
MPTLIEYVSTAEELLALQPEDLGMVLLQLLQVETQRNFTKSNFFVLLYNTDRPGYPANRKEAVFYAVEEAWQWLLNEGLIMVAPDQPNGYFTLTRKGRKIQSSADIEAYRHGNLLPVGLLHPSIAEKVRPMFQRGDYDPAVLQAFKTVEMAVRKASGLTDSDIGTKLMQAAFRPEGGPLTTPDADGGEKVGIMQLFTGAIAYCKNPASHRSPGYDHLEAAQLLVFASYLLGRLDEIVASRS